MLFSLPSPSSRRGFGHCDELNIFLVIVLILVVLAIPNFRRARDQARAKSCREHLLLLSQGSAAFARERGKFPQGVEEVKPWLADPLALVCPNGGTYSWILPPNELGSASLAAQCSLHTVPAAP